ncbi:MAG TPA: hypothetical protein VFZ75_06570 [Actinomycetota bacterium]|nr:hypothetical protein [Actinomycetota bacterium]
MSAVAGADAAAGAAGPFAVDVRADQGGWSVAIVQDGADVSVRACRDEEEARTYASTVRQHLAWLSPPKFREYYRLRQEA